jgi:hypothetical protein
MSKNDFVLLAVIVLLVWHIVGRMAQREANDFIKSNLVEINREINIIKKGMENE